MGIRPDGCASVALLERLSVDCSDVRLACGSEARLRTSTAHGASVRGVGRAVWRELPSGGFSTL